MSLADRILDAIAANYVTLLVVFAILTALEFATARERQTLRSRAAGLLYWALSIPVGMVLLQGWMACRDALGLRPLLTLPVFASVAELGMWGTILGVLVAATVQDFFFYWFHRAQHRWFWRFHAVHHSVESLNAVNSYHHLSEGFVSLALRTLPASLIVMDAQPAVPLLTLLLSLHAIYIHSSSRLHFGRGRALFVDNRFHRIHHSREERHFDHNFGAFTTLWDRLFGTAHDPARDEWPAVGIAELPQPENLRDWLDLPSRYKAATRPAPGHEPKPSGAVLT